MADGFGYSGGSYSSYGGSYGGAYGTAYGYGTGGYNYGGYDPTAAPYGGGSGSSGASGGGSGGGSSGGGSTGGGGRSGGGSGGGGSQQPPLRQIVRRYYTRPGASQGQQATPMVPYGAYGGQGQGQGYMNRGAVNQGAGGPMYSPLLILGSAGILAYLLAH